MEKTCHPIAKLVALISEFLNFQFRKPNNSIIDTPLDFDNEPTPASFQYRYLCKYAIDSVSGTGFWSMLYVVFLSAWARFKLLFLLSIALAAISSLSLITSPKLFQNIIDTTIRQPQQAFERLPVTSELANRPSNLQYLLFLNDIFFAFSFYLEHGQ
jgi:hypothetical protein